MKKNFMLRLKGIYTTILLLLTLLFSLTSEKVTAQNIITVAGNGSTTNSGDGGMATNAGVSGPLGMKFDASGNLYFVAGNRIRKMTPAGIISTVAGNDTAGYSGDGGPATAAKLNEPTDLVFDAGGNMYIADRGSDVIRVINTGGIISTYAGTYNVYTSTGDGGSVSAATFAGPSSIAFDPTGTIMYICDEGGERIRKVVGGIISNFTGSGVSGFGGDGGPATSGSVRFDAPVSLAVDASGNVYIADYYNDKIRKVSTTGAINTVFTGTSGNQSFVTCKPDGTLYVFDNTFNTLKQVSTGGVVTTVAGSGTAGFSGDNGPAISATISNGQGMALDAYGNLFFSDNGNSRIREIEFCPPPAGGEIIGSNDICLGSPAAYTDTAAGGIWSSSNTSIATVDVSGMVTGVAAGNAQIYYTVTTACGSASDTALITVNDPSGATITTSSATICPGDIVTLTFTGTPGTTLTYREAIGDEIGAHLYDTLTATIAPTGFIDIPVTTIRPGLAGNAVFDYTLLSGTAGSCSATYPSAVAATFTRQYIFASLEGITGTAAYTIPTDVMQHTFVCPGNTVDMTLVTEGNATAVISTYSAAAGTLSYDTVTVPPTGNYVIHSDPITDTLIYTVVAISNNSCSQFTMYGPGFYSLLPLPRATITSRKITTFTLPDGPSVDIDGSTDQVCAGTYRNIDLGFNVEELNVVGGSTYPPTLTYSMNGGTDITVPMEFYPTPTRINTGTITENTVIRFTQVADNSGCLTNISDSISLFVTTPTDAGSIVGPDSLCAGTVAIFTDTASGGTWLTNDPLIATIDGVGNLYAVSSGTVTVRYTTTSLSCGDATVTHDITVNPLPHAGSLSSLYDTMCPGSSVVVNSIDPLLTPGYFRSTDTSVATVDGSTGYALAIAGGTTDIVYTTATYSCGADSARLTLTIFDAPHAGVITGPDTLCAGSPATFVSSGDATGTWSLFAVAAATINAATGEVTGYSEGPAVISYTVSSAHCGVEGAVDTTHIFTGPGETTGITLLHGGAATVLHNPVTSGSWSSSDDAIATVDAAGTVYANATGVAIISYTTSCGTDTFSLRVYNLLEGVSGPGDVTACDGVPSTISVVPDSFTVYDNNYWYVSVDGGASFSLLTDDATYSGTNNFDLNINATAAMNGYMYLFSDGSDFTDTAVLTVNAVPVAGILTGADSICANTSDIITTTGTGGMWSVTDPLVATVDASGNVTGLMAGTDTVLYTVSSASCGSAVSARYLAVLAVPGTGIISGASPICVGSMTTLTTTGTGGEWGSLNAAVADVDASGVVTGNMADTTTVTYTISTFSCGSAIETFFMTVQSPPSAGMIAGPDSVCMGSSISLTNTTATTGFWTSQVGHIAINAATGVAIGTSLGTDSAVYTAVNSCGSVTTSYAVTVNALPDAGSISGADSICFGLSATLNASVSGGIWSSADAIVDVEAATGELTGMGAGLATITYTMHTSGCGDATTTYDIFIKSLPDPGTISGSSDTVCAGTTLTLSASAAGGEWTSSDDAIATVDAGGGITAVAAGNVTITYTASVFGCSSAFAIYDLTVQPLPVAGSISGSDSVCAGATVTLVSTVPGGMWSSSTAAGIDTGGVVTGVTQGMAAITYTMSSYSCGMDSAFYNVYVNAVPGAGTLTGTDSVTIGAGIDIMPTVTGGTWTSGSTNASVDASGHVTGVTAGVATISYAVANTCGTGYATKDILVTNCLIPDAGTVSGSASICAGSTTTVTSSTTGGTWMGDNDAIATIDASGIVSGIAEGSVAITYTVANTCGADSSYYSVTINALPDAGAISGAGTVCAGGATITLSNTATGGSWTSSDDLIATVDGAGVVTGVAGGAVTITYTGSSVSCGTATTLHAVTVDALPDAGIITGFAQVCEGNDISLASTVAGGTWSSDNDAVATIDGSGVVAGVAAGSVAITYTVANVCGTDSAYYSITINALPDAGTISGAGTVCAGGATITLSNTATGGSWTSSDDLIATVDGAGVVTGVAGGAVTITYTGSSVSCGSATTLHAVTVDALPDAGIITGFAQVCEGNDISLASTVAGGTWSSDNDAVATIDGSGVVAGVAAGSVLITYTVANGCGSDSSYFGVNVNSLPVVNAITGTTFVCVGGTATLADATAGGTWSSSYTSIASIDPMGVVSVVSAGSVTISYSVTNSSGCTTTQTILFTGVPMAVLSPISGPSVVAALSAITLTDSAAGGVWTSSDASHATINSVTGVVTGVAIGTTIITYTTTSSAGCTAYVTYPVTVAGSLTSSVILPVGSATLCHGGNVNLVSITAGGTTGLAFQWYIDGLPIAGATNSSYITDTFGYFTLQISNAAGSDTLTGVSVILPPHPIVQLTGANTLYTGSFSTYQWYKDSVVIAGATTSIYNETAPGGYFVVVSDGNGCTDTSEPYYVWPVGVQNVNNDISIRLYPNPASSVITIDASIAVNIRLLTADGKTVLQAGNATSIDVGDLAAGIYMVMIYDKDNNLLKTERLMKVE